MGEPSPIIRKRHDRRMERAELLGSHTHQATPKLNVHIWRRAGKYLVRGRLHGKAFGEELGSDPVSAAGKLRRVLVELEDGVYIRPSDRTDRPLTNGIIPKFTIRQFITEFLSEKRRIRGKRTMQDYRARLTPLLEFSEQAEVRRRYPLAQDVDRGFALELRSFLYQRTVTRNGRPGGTETRMSPRQVFNVLDCARTTFNWGKRPEVGKLPTTFLNPFSREIVGQKPHRDLLRPVLLPIESRIRLVEFMDEWQLTHFAIPLTLALRPEDFTGLLIQEVDFASQVLKFSARFGGRDFNKGNQSFRTAFPAEISTLLRCCVGGREDGPLLRKRTVYERRRAPRLRSGCVGTNLDVALLAAPVEAVQTPQDQKRLFRRVLREMGGVSKDALAKEFKSLRDRVGLAPDIRFYDLRGSITTEMDRAGVSELCQLYVTGHATGHKILREYVSLDLTGQMQVYFQAIRPLLSAIQSRAQHLGLDAICSVA